MSSVLTHTHTHWTGFAALQPPPSMQQLKEHRRDLVGGEFVDFFFYGHLAAETSTSASMKLSRPPGLRLAHVFVCFSKQFFQISKDFLGSAGGGGGEKREIKQDQPTNCSSLVNNVKYNWPNANNFARIPPLCRRHVCSMWDRCLYGRPEPRPSRTDTQRIADSTLLIINRIRASQHMTWQENQIAIG